MSINDVPWITACVVLFAMGIYFNYRFNQVSKEADEIRKTWQSNTKI